VSLRITLAAGLALAELAGPSVAWADPAPPVAPQTPPADDVDIPAAGASAAPPASSAIPSPAPSAVPPPAPASSVPPAATPSPSPSSAASPPAGVPATPGSSAAPAVASASTQEIAELRARLEALEAKADHEPAHPIVRSDLSITPTTSLDGSPWSRVWPRGFVIGGYVQGQYQHSQLSQDQLDANGTPLNQNRFLVRRARLRVDRGWDFASATVEVDGNNNNGIAFGLRRAEGSLLLRAADPSAPPLLAFTVGLSDIPFGYELFDPNRSRLFLERTTASRAFFPGDNDFGARVTGALGFFRYAVAILDGTPVPDSEPASAGLDPTSEKDIMARFGAEAQPRDDLGVGGGVSFVRGTGFHAGTPATKDSFQWRDLNGNGAVDAGETQALPGSAATPSETFSRWALGFDLQLRLKTPIGRGMLYGEAYVGSNYDRGLFVADPVATGVDLREVGWYVGYLQEITPFAVVGLRVDAYNPNGDATSQVAGNILPRNQTITTYSPLVGLVLPNRARLVFEYDRIRDHEGLDARGVPTDLRNDQWALRLQVEL
jgi:hypothetical protein